MPTLHLLCIRSIFDYPKSGIWTTRWSKPASMRCEKNWTGCPMSITSGWTVRRWNIWDFCSRSRARLRYRVLDSKPFFGIIAFGCVLMRHFAVWETDSELPILVVGKNIRFTMNRPLPTIVLCGVRGINRLHCIIIFSIICMFNYPKSRSMPIGQEWFWKAIFP